MFEIIGVISINAILKDVKLRLSRKSNVKSAASVCKTNHKTSKENHIGL